jgi:predicted dehydrogenase
MNRRSFLRRTASAAAAVSIPAYIPAGVFAAPGQPGANDRIRIAFIGCGGRARHLMSPNEDLSQAEIVAVCDTFLPRTEEAAKARPDGAKWAKYQDYRKMFEQSKLDAVFVETTCHARVLIMIHALQAGLDVYGEKPLTLTIAEGRTLVKAVRKHNKILQTGTQQRSMPINMHVSRLIREGVLGKGLTVTACNFEGPKRWTPKEGQPVPAGLDWDAWCNQAELRPYHRDLQYGWSDWWDYDGGGQCWGVSGWGTHSLDQVQCALGTSETGPVEVWMDEDVPNGKVTMKYANGVLLKLHGAKRPWNAQTKVGLDDLGAIFQGENGKIELVRGNYRAEPKELVKDTPPPSPCCEPKESVDHLKNFFDCLRSRKLPNADVEIGHRSTTVCQLVNICRDLKRKLTWDPKAEQFVGDAEANKMLSRPRRKGYELPAI